jgi:cytochrome c oxidase subunit 3
MRAGRPAVPEAAARVAQQFEDLEQERETVGLGMWIFLAQEVMFFGGLFTVYAVYRRLHRAAFAEASRHLDLVLGTANTAVLLLSSLTMALAVRAAQRGSRRMCALYLGGTMSLGAIFLGVKALEYAHKVRDGLLPGPGFDAGLFRQTGAELFFSLYFVMTGMHALHMLIGIALLACVLRRALRGRYGPQRHWGVEVLGLYWHFVDVVWIFLFPLLYLFERHA